VRALVRAGDGAIVERALLDAADRVPWDSIYVDKARGTFTGGTSPPETTFDWHGNAIAIARQKVAGLRAVAHLAGQRSTDDAALAFDTFWFNLHLPAEYVARIAPVVCDALRAHAPDSPATVDLMVLREAGQLGT